MFPKIVNFLLEENTMQSCSTEKVSHRPNGQRETILFCQKHFWAGHPAQIVWASKLYCHKSRVEGWSPAAGPCFSKPIFFFFFIFFFPGKTFLVAMAIMACYCVSVCVRVFFFFWDDEI